jgi:hypothetical protein
MTTRRRRPHASSYRSTAVEIDDVWEAQAAESYMTTFNLPPSILHDL